jgi:hypothetical protein
MVFRVTDIQAYAPGAALADLTGRLKITAPSGVVYDNLSGSADIDLDVSRVNSTTIQVPKLSDGTPEIGLYTFEYVVTDSSDASTATLVKTLNFSYVKPTPANSAEADCISPELSGSDTTNYLVDGITPVDRFSVVSSDAVANTFTIAGEKVGFFPIGEKFDIIGGTANDGEYVVTGVEYDLTNTIVSVASVANTLAPAGTLVQRRTTLYFVSVPDVQPEVSYDKTITVSDFYSQTQSFSFDANAYYDLGSGFTIVDSFFSHRSIDVTCDDGLCAIFCCINSVYGEYMKYKGVNDTLANLALERYAIITSHLAALRTALECGNTQAAASLTDEIKKVAQCNDDCDCDSSEAPVKITGLGNPNIVVVDSSGNGIEVSSNTSGSTTTYTLSLDAATIAKLNSITANTTSSVISSDGSVTVSSAVDTPTAGNTQYDISVPAAKAPKEWLAFDVEIIPAGPGAATFNVTNVTHQESTVNNMTPLSISVAYENTTPVSNSQAIKIENFQTTPNTTYKAFVEVVNNTYQFSPFLGTPSSTRYDLAGFNPMARITVKESGKIEFILLKGENVSYTITEFDNAFSNVKLNVKIVE